MVEGVPGAIAGVLMGYDGIAIDSFANKDGGADIQTIGMEFSFVLSQIRKAAEALEVGTPSEVIIRAEHLTILARTVSSEYFLALALTPEGNSGKGRFVLRIAVPKLKAEL
jgi:predicted regulator of Ras-like GTPase activity (Roadblock/LC7/MglB family)